MTKFLVILVLPVVSAIFHKFIIFTGLKAENVSWSEMRAVDNDVECCLLCDSHPACIAANTANGTCELVGKRIFEINPLQGWITLFQAGKVDGQFVATQSSQHHLQECPECGEANRALDGNTDGEYYSGSCTSTDKNDSDNWWKVDFQSIYLVSGVVIWNRKWGLYVRLRDLRISVAVLESQLDDQSALCAEFNGPPNSTVDNPIRINCKKPMLGRFLKIHKKGPTIEPLHLCEIKFM